MIIEQIAYKVATKIFGRQTVSRVEGFFSSIIKGASFTALRLISNTTSKLPSFSSSFDANSAI